MRGDLIEAFAPGAGAARAAALFRATYGIEPDGVWSSPGRVNLVGEHTDYNGGLCLPIALPHRTYAALRRTEQDTDGLELVSAQEQAPSRVAFARVGPLWPTGWTAYPTGVAWALTNATGTTVAGWQLAVDSCVPYGAGLSSSAALECAVGLGLDEVFGLGLSADDEGRALLAQACIEAENVVAGAATGGMDQSASLLCRPGHALLLDTGAGTRRHVPLDMAAEGLALLVVDTRAPHQLVDGQYAARRATCEAIAARVGVRVLGELAPDDLPAAAAALVGPVTLPDGTVVDVETQRRRLRHVVTEIARVRAVVALAAQGRLAEAGPLLDASHASLRDDYEVSCPELDLVASAAREAGALGARMTGGGFGGSAIALVEQDRVDDVLAHVRAAFARAGFARPDALVATPAGAGNKEEQA
ncbi:galactokinase [Cellulomonas composti]|uniref:Galactokinase n=1 Tax=Cellulomonas composti TaxID=266130 RepID=A0A511J9F5_9CELL|nr:galactokinase [Cellulomonas composti]GEL94610.1 galactokinase [Cellulomonas composti]